MKNNTYICQKCKGEIVTINADVGVTPFMLRCRAKVGCDGTMESQFGRVRNGAIAWWTWYLRTDVARMSDEELMHAQKGGAFIRKMKTPVLVGERPKL